MNSHCKLILHFDRIIADSMKKNRMNFSPWDQYIKLKYIHINWKSIYSLYHEPTCFSVYSNTYIFYRELKLYTFNTNCNSLCPKFSSTWPFSRLENLFFLYDLYIVWLNYIMMLNKNLWKRPSGRKFQLPKSSVRYDLPLDGFSHVAGVFKISPSWN